MANGNEVLIGQVNQAIYEIEESQEAVNNPLMARGIGLSLRMLVVLYQNGNGHKKGIVLSGMSPFGVLFAVTPPSFFTFLFFVGKGLKWW